MNITHQHENQTLDQIKQQIIKQGDQPEISVDELLKIVEGLNRFPLGRFLLFHHGLNGFWTHYIVTHPERETQKLSQYERLLLEQLPISLATQERYKIFKSILQSQVREGIRMASVPCGLMGELLALDYSTVHDFSLKGADLDQESVKLAEKWAEDLGLSAHCTFECEDAWKFSGTYDVIASNGLNLYVSDEQRVIELYRAFHNALESDGLLVTSFLTPPPNHPEYASEWKLSAIPQQGLGFQKILFSYVAQPKFQNFLPEAAVRKQLMEAGFKRIEVTYDKAHLFPTVCAYKTD